MEYSYPGTKLVNLGRDFNQAFPDSLYASTRVKAVEMISYASLSWTGTQTNIQNSCAAETNSEVLQVNNLGRRQWILDCKPLILLLIHNIINLTLCLQGKSIVSRRWSYTDLYTFRQTWIGVFLFVSRYNHTCYYMPTAHSLLWLVRLWSHDHLTKVILGCNITFQHSDSELSGLCAQLSTWTLGKETNRSELRQGTHDLGRELGKHIFKLNNKSLHFWN